MNIWVGPLGHGEIPRYPFFQKISLLPYEMAWVLFLKGSRTFGLKSCCQNGDENGVQLPSVEQIRSECLKLGVRQILLMHNHPPIQGRCSPLPSGLDITTTKQYKRWLKKFDIELRDHIILSPVGYYSLGAHRRF